MTVISDGAEIMKRLPKVLPKPTAHIIDWFHIATKIQPMQQIADHIVRCRDEWTNETVILDEEIRAPQMETVARTSRSSDAATRGIDRRHGDVTRTRRPERRAHMAIGASSPDIHPSEQGGRLSITELDIDQGAGSLRHSLSPAVDTLVARRMVKKQQMQWSLQGAHRMLQVRAAVLNGDLSKRLAWRPPEPTHRHHFAWIFEPTPPLLEAA